MKRSLSSRAHRAPLFVVLGGLLVVSSTPSWAQTTAPAPSTSPATPGVPPATAPAFSAPSPSSVQAVGPNFKLQPGDVLAVQVANHPEMSAQTVAVAANGQLNLPVVGALTAQGKTLGTVTAQITRAYASQLKRPQVSVTLVSSIPRQLIVRGAVGKPGPIDVRSDLRLSEAISGLGGLMIDGVAIASNQAKGTLVRPGMAPKALDIDTALNSPDSPANIALRAGDILNITAMPQITVSMGGDGVVPTIVKARFSKTQSQYRITDILALGGNLHAKPDQIKGSLIRNGKPTPINVPALFDGSDANANLVVQTGDILEFDTIPAKKVNVTVVSEDGSVKTPGNYTFDDSTSALRTLYQAGGFAESVRADQVKITVKRGNRTIPVNVAQVINDPTQDIPLENNDVVLASYNPSPQVLLSGSVVKPQQYRLKEGATLMDAVNLAGGLTLPPPQTAIRIVRTTADGKQIPINVDANRLFGQADLSQNVRLQDGDSIYVSQYGGVVYVNGEVTTPGPYTATPGEGLSEVLLKAGGAKPTAALSRVVIGSRDGSKKVVDASAVAQGAKVDIKLDEGDYVTVPLNPDKVVVWGAVTKVGPVPIPENQVLTVGDALIQAGGTASNARLQEVAVVHRLPDGKTQIDKVPVNEVGNGVITTDYPLRNGDIVWVPQGKVTQGGLSQLQRLLGVASLAGNLFF